jgi:hypothetical protein
MVAWWKRLLLSLMSLIIAAILCFLAVVAYSALKSHPVSFRSGEVILTVGVMVGFCIVVWIFSIPVVLIITNIRGWRFWFYWVLGSCVGPALMLALSALIFLKFPQTSNGHLFNPVVIPLLYVAGGISCLTAIFYLLLLRSSQAKAERRLGLRAK